MNQIQDIILKKANDEIIYNIFLYLAHNITPAENDFFYSLVTDLEMYFKKNTIPKTKDIYQLNILKNAIIKNKALANSIISNLTISGNGLTACSFTKPSGDISVVFKGTGGGEWIDNGEGLSGIPEENTYFSYDSSGEILYGTVVQTDYSTDQQVEALNWFNKIAAKNNWNSHTNITVSGHSKGGNKAQFIAINSDLIRNCFSFNGQGFSPEALTLFKTRCGNLFKTRQNKIKCFSSDNDYVNVLGKRLAASNNIYYFKSLSGLHSPESILETTGQFRPQSVQGKLSKYVENISDEIMNMQPSLRQYATLGLMNIFQKYLGDGIPVNGDSVSLEKTIAGIGIIIRALLKQLKQI